MVGLEWPVERVGGKYWLGSWGGVMEEDQEALA